MADLSPGPLTRADLQAIWEGAVDRAYREPFLAAGEGEGLEAHSQLWELLARASTAIDVTTQEMFISPWSGQTNPPAAGEAKATVDLTFTRSKRTEQPLVLGVGFVVDEVQTDWGPNGGVMVRTGRRYTLTEAAIFHPGEMGPVTVAAQAERPGHGYNNPLPGSLSGIPQPGAAFENDEATIVEVAFPAPMVGVPGTGARYDLITANEADTPIPDHVGQYVIITGGTANVGRIGRAVSFAPPDLSVTPAIGSTVQLALDQDFESTSFSGTFVVGETVRINNPGLLGYGVVVGERIVGGVKKLLFVITSSVVAASYTGTIAATGLLSGALATVANFTYLPRFYTAEVGTVAWRVLTWGGDWGLEVTNEASPTGGRLGMLDELGNERGINRGPGEQDDSYRQRVREIADVVTPNAIKRTLNRTLGTLPWCFREVGMSELRGWYFDGDLGPVGGLSNTALTVAGKDDAYDTDCVLFGGATGMTYDAGLLSAYDSGAYLSFYGGWGDGVFSAIPIANYNEPAVVEDTSNNVYMRGYFGRLLPGPSSTIILVFIRTSGRLPSSTAGLRVRGLISGATFNLVSSSVPATAIERRWRTYFDYAEFRAFFLVGLPRLSAGEFGFPYDGGSITTNAYDAAPYSAFYDGFPVVASEIYRRVYDALDSVRAGGVFFGVYAEEYACP
jgi:hypothetical protein